MAADARRTPRQRNGAWAEQVAGAYLRELGWEIVASNVRVGRDEIDHLAVEPGAQPALVFVEVRSLRARGFGAPEERVDRAKVGRLYRAAVSLTQVGRLPGGGRLPRLPWRVDLVVVDRRGAAPQLRHLRRVEPP